MGKGKSSRALAESSALNPGGSKLRALEHYPESGYLGFWP